MDNKRPQTSESLKGNKNGIKLKNPDVRQRAFEEYCQHLKEGYPREAFFYDDGEHSACWETVEKYIEENPTEFPPIKIKQAMSARYKHWFGEGKTLMKGGYPGGSPVVWQTIMRNMFKNVKWDHKDMEEPQKSSPEMEMFVAKAKDLAAH